MPLITRRRTIIDQVDTIQTKRALRRHGFKLSLSEICDLVDAGHTPERNQVTSQLLAASSDDTIEAVLVAAYSGYLSGLIRDTSTVELPRKDMWAIGLEALLRAVKASARCDGGDFHIIKSTHRDFCRAMTRHRSQVRSESKALRLLEAETWVALSFDDWSALTIDELVEWVATEFDAEERVARMVVATRLGGYPLGGKDDPTARSRNCRDRQRLEQRMRGFISPAEGLAANVLSRAA